MSIEAGEEKTPNPQQLLQATSVKSFGGDDALSDQGHQKGSKLEGENHLRSGTLIASNVCLNPLYTQKFQSNVRYKTT